ncbi:hypothetical protein RHCRD62_60394 [Rhodococcus sp. RD6.2]|nr:hypothetical protein RHCRD62_60394 [Rhodococcus sp. RD6.2]
MTCRNLGVCQYCSSTSSRAYWMVNGTRASMDPVATRKRVMLAISPIHVSIHSWPASSSTKCTIISVPKNATSRTPRSFTDRPRTRSTTRNSTESARAAPAASSSRPGPSNTARTIHGASPVSGPSSRAAKASKARRAGDRARPASSVTSSREPLSTIAQPSPRTVPKGADSATGGGRLVASILSPRGVRYGASPGSNPQGELETITRARADSLAGCGVSSPSRRRRSITVGAGNIARRTRRGGQCARTLGDRTRARRIACGVRRLGDR